MAAKVLASSGQATTKRVLGAENTGVIAAVSTNAYHNTLVLIFIVDIDFPFYWINVWLLYSYCMRREFLQTEMILSILIISTSTIVQHRENLFCLDCNSECNSFLFSVPNNSTDKILQKYFDS